MHAFLKSCSNFERTLLIYIALFGLHGILLLPYIGNKAQLSDILFPLLAFYFFKENKTRLKHVPIPVWALITLGTILDIGLISALIHYNFNTLIESLARYYLFVLGAMVFIHFYFQKSTFRTPFFGLAFIWAALIGAGVGLLGILLHQIGIDNRAALFYPDFPYLGDTYRLTAFFASPNMLVLLFSFALSFLLEDLSSRFNKIACTLIGLALCFTFAKGLLLLIPLILVRVLNLNQSTIKSWIWMPFIFLFLLLSHLQFKSIDSDPNSMYGSADTIYTTETLQVLKTSYTTNKETALRAFHTAPLFGLGVGNFNAFVDQQKELGRYPTHYYSYDPHSTWFGTLAELGILGFIALICLVVYLIQGASKLELTMPLNKVLLPIFLILLVESITMDMLNFRFLYILLGLFILQIENGSKNESSIE